MTQRREERPGLAFGVGTRSTIYRHLNKTTP
jgi:hypothetical protein